MISSNAFRLVGHAALACALACTACGRGALVEGPSGDASGLVLRDAARGADDLGVALRVRRAIVADETLTTPPSKIKVLARDGAVRLRGAVASEAERERIAETARRIAGATRVTNELEVADARLGGSSSNDDMEERS